MKLLDHRFGNDGVSTLTIFVYAWSNRGRFFGSLTRIFYVNTSFSIAQGCLERIGR